MAIREIDLGFAVDTGSGDYLRRGGQKINDNFDEVYSNLGDGTQIHPSSLGIIRHSYGSDGATLDAEIGKIYSIDTSTGPVTVNMPDTSTDDVGRSITFIDPNGTWNTNGVTFVSAGNDTFGVETQVDVVIRYAMTVFTYTSQNIWLYNPGQRLDRYTDVAEASRVSREVNITADEQTDFTDIFPVKYNDAAIEVRVNGVDLYYGESLNSKSEFGSIGTNPGDLIALNGFDIRLKNPAVKGDIVKFVTYLRSTGTTPTSTEQHTVKVIPDSSGDPEIDGEVIKRDMSGNTEIDVSIQDMGGSSVDEFNIDAVDVYVNGSRITRRGDAGLITGTCSDPTYDNDESACLAIPGNTWTPSWEEYGIVFDGNGRPTILRISTNVLNVSGENYITAQTYNYQLGTLSTISDVLSETNDRYMNTEATITRTNKISYTDIANPSNETVQAVPGSENTRFDIYTKLLETIYPVGSLYFNAHNSANPADYMGFGIWRRYAQGRAIVGWDSQTVGGNYDPDFGLNNNDLDEFGNEQATAGATRGQKSFTLSTNNIPLLSVAGEWLKKAAGATGFFKNYGNVGNNINPTSSYNEEEIETGTTNPDSIDNIQPSITVYCWIRVE